MAKKKRKVETPIPVDPNAQKFEVGDEIVVQRPNIIWGGYKGAVRSVDGGVCVCVLNGPSGKFLAPILATELKLEL